MTFTCNYGHEMSGDNVYRWKEREFCRTCHRERQQNYRRKDRKGHRSKADHYTPPRPRRDTGDTYVYFIGDGVGHVKIGVTERIDSRLAELQTGNAHELTVLVYEEGGYGLEHEYHVRFDQHRIRGSNEWFFLAPEIEDWIDYLRRLL